MWSLLGLTQVQLTATNIATVPGGMHLRIYEDMRIYYMVGRSDPAYRAHCATLCMLSLSCFALHHGPVWNSDSPYYLHRRGVSIQSIHTELLTATCATHTHGARAQSLFIHRPIRSTL